MAQDYGMATYSYSQLKTFEQCPLKYKFEYIDHRQKHIESVEGFTGKRVHEALKMLYKGLLRRQLPRLHELIDFYRFNWDRQWHRHIRIVKRTKTERDYFCSGARCIENFYLKNWPFKQSRTVYLEKRFEFRIDPRARRRFVGKVDRLASPRAGHYEIHEYKTGRGKSRPEHDVQLSLYQIAVESEFPEARRIDLFCHHLSEGTTHRFRPRESDLRQILRNTSELIDRIESERRFAPRPNRLCRWCEFRDVCPAFADRRYRSDSD